MGWKDFFNSLQKQPPKIKMRPTIFVVQDSWGSAIMCGYQVSGAIQEMGLPTEVINIWETPRKLKSMKNCNMVFIKKSFRDNRKLLTHLKHNGNALIWNPTDGYLDCQKEPDLDLFDGVMTPNKKCAQEWRASFRDDCIVKEVYLHWDPRVKPNHAKDFKLVYAGICRPESIHPDFIEKLADLHIVEFKTLDVEEQKRLLESVRAYNCHFSIRETSHPDFMVKPNSKISFAAASDANIILTRDQSYIELLDESYPYYTSSDFDSVYQTVQYAKESYGSAEWQRGLEMMREVKEKTSIQKIAKDTLTFLSQIN